MGNILDFTQYRIQKLVQENIKKYNPFPLLSTLNSLTYLIENFYQTNDQIAFDQGLQQLTLTTNIKNPHL
jgi:hypothetical protein